MEERGGGEASTSTHGFPVFFRHLERIGRRFNQSRCERDSHRAARVPAFPPFRNSTYGTILREVNRAYIYI